MSDFWYAWDVGSYAKKTAHLTMIQHGAYRLLLDHYYNNGGPIVANAEQLLRVCRAFAPAEREAIDVVLAEFFELRDGRYHNRRCDEEIAKRTNLRKIRAEAGAKGGASARANAQANAKQLPTQLQLQSHIQIQEEERVEVRVTAPLTPTKKLPKDPDGSKGTRWPSEAVVPEDWFVDGAMFRANAGLPEIDLATEGIKFANYWSAKSGADAAKRDWRKTWLNWCLKANGAGYGKPNGQHGKTSAAAEVFGSLYATARAQRESTGD